MEEAKLGLLPSEEVRRWAKLCHFSAFLALVAPFGNLLGPLLVWQLKKDLDPLVDAQGKEALNFQITMSLVSLVGLLMLVSNVLMLMTIGFVLIGVVAFATLVLMLIAGIKANAGQAYRYPVNWRLIR